MLIGPSAENGLILWCHINMVWFMVF